MPLYSARTTDRLQPEMRLLLLCIRPDQNEETRDQIRRLTNEPLDWDALLELASWHTVSPLLYWNGSAAHWDCPPEVERELRARFTANSFHNLFLTGETCKLARRFHEHGIRAVIYKGPLLTPYYENPGLREFHDIDVLISKDDIVRSNQMFESAALHASEQRFVFARAFDFELTYESEDQQVWIDLHWALMPGFAALHAEDEMRSRTITVDLSGVPVQTLDHSDLLLFLCAHGTKHIWESLGWTCDIARVVRAHPDLDWNLILERAARFRMTKALSLGLFLASDLLGLALPAEIQSRISSDESVQHLADEVYQQLFVDRSSHWGAIASTGFLMRSRDTRLDGLRCVAERLLRPTKAEWRSIRFPRALFPLYYPLRVARMLGKHAARR